MLQIILTSVIGLSATIGNAPPLYPRYLVPTTYEAGHFYTAGTTIEGKTLHLLVDSGGVGGSGLYVIDPDAVERLGLQASHCELGAESSDVVTSISFTAGEGWPKSIDMPCGATALVMRGIGQLGMADGIIGAGFMPRHSWTFD